MTNRTIKFYKTGDPYGEFSNFAAFPILIGGKVWNTSEHFFQAQKFVGTEHEEAVRLAASPMAAAQLGRDRGRPLRDDWETVKDDVMLIALRAKFTQHPQLASLLLSTHGAELIEHTRNDRYWGDGGDGTGANRLGQLLGQVRAELASGQLPATSEDIVSTAQPN